MAQPLRYSTKRSLVAQELERAIIRGELQPGQWLRQSEVADQFGVSPTPVREALRDLESRGLVEYVPNRGVHVHEVRVEDLLENEMIRCVLEPLATGLAAHGLADEALARVESHQQRFARAVHGGDVQGTIKGNEDFHMTLYAEAGAPQLLEIIRTLWARFRWEHLALLPGRPQATIGEHEAILRALRRRDAEAAERACAEHLRRARDDFVAYLKATREVLPDGHAGWLRISGDGRGHQRASGRKEGS